MGAKIARWFFFSILFALIPLVFAFSKVQAVGPEVDLRSLIARGGLLLIAAGLSAGAIGDLLLSGTDWLKTKVSAGGFCALNMVAASLFYVVVSDAYTLALRDNEPVEANMDVGFVFWLSVILYGLAIFTSLIFVWIAAETASTDTAGTEE